MTPQTKGTLCGIIAAVSYGTNPLGALYLYQAGLNTDTVLFYRYFLAAIVLMGIMKLQKTSFSITLKEFSVLGGLGILFAISSLTLFSSFHFMDAGVASTLLFVYPIMVAVIMALFFKEKITATTAISIALALGGIAMLYKGDGNEVLSTIGIILVMASSLSYALYIIVVNRSGLRMSSVKLTFYVLLFSIVVIVIHSFTAQSYHLQPLTTPYMWFFAILLALLPTVISLVTMSISVRNIGSTPTAILGALDRSRPLPSGYVSSAKRSPTVWPGVSYSYWQAFCLSSPENL